MKNYNFFQHKECNFFPCKDVPKLNCLFCFCPIYCIANCGGNYTILDNGWKDCSKCNLPHSDDGYNIIIKKIREEYSEN